MSSPERDERLRRADRARQQGRLDLAIVEFEELVAAYPDDMSLANTLGDLHVGHGQPGPALPLFLRVGDHFFREGFYSKAVGIYRKVLKFVPRDESMIVRLAEALAAQGLTVEARMQFAAVATARRQRGDARGAEDVALRLADLDPADLAARWSAARTLAQRGDAAAVGRYEDLATEFERQHRFDEALAVWHEVIALAPADAMRRERAARRAWARGDAASATIFLAVDDLPPHGPALALLTEIALRSNTPEGIRAVAGAWLDADQTAQPGLLQLALEVSASDPERAWACVAVLAERALAGGRPTDAELALRMFVATGVLHGPALVMWVEVAVRAHVDGVVSLVRERLMRLPLTPGQPVTARAVVEAAARRVAPHGAWADLFDECLGPGPGAVPAGVPSAEADSPASSREAAPHGAPAHEAPLPPMWPGVPPEPQFVEVDMTAALNAISVHDSGAAGPPAVSAVSPAAEAGVLADDPARHAPAPVSDADALATLALGHTYLAAGMLDQARLALVQALDAPHTAARAALALADMHDDAGEPADACRVLERVLPSAAGRPREQVLAQLVVSLEHTGDTAGAQQRLRELAEVAPDHPVVRARHDRRGAPGE